MLSHSHPGTKVHDSYHLKVENLEYTVQNVRKKHSEI